MRIKRQKGSDALLEEVKEKIFSGVLIGALIMALPFISVALWRGHENGFLPSTIVATASVASYGLLFFIKKKIPLFIRIHFVLGTSILSVTFSTWTYGVLSQILPVFLEVAVLATLFLSIRGAITYLCVESGIIVFYLYMYATGKIPILIDVEAYFSSTIIWIGQLVGLLLFGIILVASVRKMVKILFDNLGILEESEEKYRALIESSEDEIFGLDGDGRVLNANQKLLDNLWLTEEEIRNMNFSEVFSMPIFDGQEEKKNMWIQRISKVYDEKKSVTFQYASEEADGKRYINTSIVPVLGTDGNIKMVIGSNRDITEVIIAQEKVQRMLEEEKEYLESRVKEEAERYKMALHELHDRERLASLGSLVSGISHEVNTPLGAAISASSHLEAINKKAYEKLKSGSLSKEDLFEYMEGIDTSTNILDMNLERAANLVRSFKEIAVNQSSEMLQEFFLRGNLNAIITSLRHEYKRKDIQFEILCSEDLKIYSYPGAFSQIFTNLIMNSIVHGLEGKTGGVVRIITEVKENQLEIQYSDNGVGMNDGLVQRIFEPFFTTKRGAGGSGLGLSIVYNIINDQLKGRVTCKSVEGKGTTFEIIIPLIGK